MSAIVRFVGKEAVEVAEVAVAETFDRGRPMYSSPTIVCLSHGRVGGVARVTCRSCA